MYTGIIRIILLSLLEYQKLQIWIIKCKVCNINFLQLPNKPGKLFKVMEIFSVYNLNMSKISSRPMKERPMEYVFMVDVDIDNNLEDIENAIKLIKRKNVFL